MSFEDFQKQFAETRAEWIDGRVELLVSNNTVHNDILAFLVALLRTYLLYRKVGVLYLAGVRMQLKIEEKTSVREPDLMVILNTNRERIQPTYFDGPADIAVEVVSPESSLRDWGEKREEYEKVGVKEYWIVDPLREEVFVFVLSSVGNRARFKLLKTDQNGNIRSSLLPDFSLNPNLFWRDDVIDLNHIEIVQTMLDET